MICQNEIIMSSKRSKKFGSAVLIDTQIAGIFDSLWSFAMNEAVFELKQFLHHTGILEWILYHAPCGFIEL